MLGQWKFLNEVHEYKNLPQDCIPEVIFWGRSNVGKSSLINSVTRSAIARTSKTPGRTRAMILFQLGSKLRIVDFPGYGYSTISKKEELKLDYLIDQYVRKRKNISKFFLLVDSLHGFKKSDEIIIKELNNFIGDKVFIIFTKKDRVKNNKQKILLEEFNLNANKKFNKKFFNTSIKQADTIILLEKFLMNLDNENLKHKY